MVLRYITPLVVLSAALVHGQANMPATTRADLSALMTLAERYTDAAKLTEETQGYYPTALIHGRCMVGFLGKANAAFDGTQEEGSPVYWGARKGNIVSLRIDAQHLDAVHELVGLDYIELAGKVKPDLNNVIWSIHADSVVRGIDLPQAYTGKDVLIGITDWGFDYTHPMFYDTLLAETRVRAAWDHYRQSGPGPVEYGYGTELTTTEDLLAAGSDTANIYSYATHGSHVAGIAGGSGAGTPYRGVAFEAKYLFCTFLVDAAAVLDAFAWMQQIAEQDEKRLVINMSWGLYYIGTLDGNSLISQAIDQFSSEGVVFVNSGGNNGDINFHIRKDFTNDTLHSRIQFYPYSAIETMWGQSISMWGDAGSGFSAGLIVTGNANQVLLETPWYTTGTQQAYLDSSLIVGSDTVYFNLTAEAAHPLNGRPHFRLRAKNRSPLLKVALKATAPTGRVHFWNVTELVNDVGNWGQEFQAAQTGWTNGNKQYGISEPACTESLITVAAYSSNYLTSGGAVAGGAIAPFSSFGPTLDERIKPDIAAPGVNVASSFSSFTDEDYLPITTVDFQGRTYPFVRISGTSMASPAVTGVVALMLQANPTLTPAQIKEAIKTNPIIDINTGEIPEGGSTRWGAGKVNAYQAVHDVLGLNEVAEVEGLDVITWPNPMTSELNVMTEVGSPAKISVMDVAGRTVLTRAQTGGGTITIPTGEWASGIYQLRVDQAGRTSIGKVIKL